jgi:hypothetical protein
LASLGLKAQDPSYKINKEGWRHGTSKEQFLNKTKGLNSTPNTTKKGEKKKEK